MTPERRREFENVWPALSRRVKSMVCRKGVTGGDVDDLVQEAALRLYRTWDQVDPTRDPWPLVSTITLNLLRDRARPRPIREITADHVPERADSYEVERAGLARIELGRVESAMAMLSASHRTALLNEIGDGATTGADSEATRMLRMRARKRLAALLEKASAILLPLRPNRIGELMEWAFGSRQVAMSTVSCLLCVALGTVTAFTGVLAPPRAFARTTRSRSDAVARRLQSQALPARDAFARAAEQRVRSSQSTGALNARVSSRTARTHKAGGSTQPSTLPSTPPLPAPNAPLPQPPPLPAPPPAPNAPLPKVPPAPQAPLPRVPLPKAPLPDPTRDDAVAHATSSIKWVAAPDK
ncbi:MAG: sigma-70 family RNA polymerase sigma factor [Actinomycetota bacterium]|nr:sigma-70 family RNA polymerase sigma factor [Actinomycetota bacterium]